MASTYFVLQAASSNDDTNESPALNSLQKLLRGICDPRMTAAMLEEEDKDDIDISDWKTTQLQELEVTSNFQSPNTKTPKVIDAKDATNDNGTPETMDSTTDGAPTVNSSFTPDSSNDNIASFDDQGNVEVVLSSPPPSPKIKQIEIPIEPSPSDELRPVFVPDSKANANDGMDSTPCVQTNPELNAILSICSVLDPEIDAFTDACAQNCDDVNAKVVIGVGGDTNDDINISVANIDITRNINESNDPAIDDIVDSKVVEKPVDMNVKIAAEGNDSDQDTADTVVQTDSDTTDSDDLVLLRKMLFPIAGVSKDDDDEEEKDQANKNTMSKEKDKVENSSSSESDGPSKNESRSLVSASSIRRALIFTVVNTVISVAIWNAGSYYMTRSNERKSTSQDK